MIKRVCLNEFISQLDDQRIIKGVVLQISSENDTTGLRVQTITHWGDAMAIGYLYTGSFGAMYPGLQSWEIRKKYCFVSGPMTLSKTGVVTIPVGYYSDLEED